MSLIPTGTARSRDQRNQKRKKSRNASICTHRPSRAGRCTKWTACSFRKGILPRSERKSSVSYSDLPVLMSNLHKNTSAKMFFAQSCILSLKLGVIFWGKWCGVRQGNNNSWQCTNGKNKNRKGSLPKR